MLQTPIFITNFKNYRQAMGKNSVELAKIHEKIAQDTGKSIAVAVNPCDLFRVSSAVNIPVFAQHIDPVDFGSYTGHILPQSVKSAGAVGTLLNHSERRLDPEILEQSLAFGQKSSLARIVCAESPEEIETFRSLDLDFLAFEPPELIGGTKSVSSESPELIKQSVEIAGEIPLLVGAGINSPEDIEVALSLGAKGFLVASAITKADDPEKALRKMVEVMG